MLRIIKHFDQNSTRRLISLGLLVVLVTAFSLINNQFFSFNNLVSILREASFIGIIAVSATFVIISGGIDISVGSTMALSAMVCANVLRFTGLPVPGAIGLALLSGLACGLLNGVAITSLGVPDFIVVLAAMGVYRGLTKVMAATDVQSLSNNMIANDLFKQLGGKIGLLHIVTAVFFVVVCLGQFLLRCTKIGLYTYAAGSSRAAASLTGIHCGRVKIFAYGFTGLMCALAGVMTSARMMTATTETGTGMEFNVIAAVVIGGASLSGGRGDVVGTFIGTLMMAVINSGTVQMGISTYYQPIIKGGIILLAILFDIWYGGRIGGGRKKTPRAAIPGNSQRGRGSYGKLGG